MVDSNWLHFNVIWLCFHWIGWWRRCVWRFGHTPRFPTTHHSDASIYWWTGPWFGTVWHLKSWRSVPNFIIGKPFFLEIARFLGMGKGGGGSFEFSVCLFIPHKSLFTRFQYSDSQLAIAHSSVVRLDPVTIPFIVKRRLESGWEVKRWQWFLLA